MIGREATYLVTIKNSGEVAAQDVAAIVKIPEWTDVAGSQVTAGTTRVAAGDANEPFQWKIPRLEAHSKETLSLRLLPRKGRGFDLAVQWTFSPIATQTIVDVQEPKLTLSLAGPDEVVYGQSKLYRLTIANPGTGDAENVIIKLDPIGNSTAGPSKHPDRHDPCRRQQGRRIGTDGASIRRGVNSCYGDGRARIEGRGGPGSGRSPRGRRLDGGRNEVQICGDRGHVYDPR